MSGAGPASELPFGRVFVGGAARHCRRDGEAVVQKILSHDGQLQIVPATPLANIHAFYDACKELGRYPLSF